MGPHTRDVPIGIWHFFVVKAREKREALAAEVATLKLCIKELEASQLQFKGTHDESRVYVQNHIVRRSGSMWICTAPTHGAFDHKCWELLVKKGDAG